MRHHHAFSVLAGKQLRVRYSASQCRPCTCQFWQAARTRVYGRIWSSVSVTIFHKCGCIPACCRAIGAGSKCPCIHGGAQYSVRRGSVRAWVTAGRRLIAHELTHVVQQRDRGSTMVMKPHDNIAHSIAPIVQRRLAVNPAATIPLPAGMAGPPRRSHRQCKVCSGTPVLAGAPLSIPRQER